jgi:hypothetical protein
MSLFLGPTKLERRDMTEPKRDRNYIELLGRLSEHTFRVENQSWPEGELVEAGSCYLIIDGLASHSFLIPVLPDPPLLGVIADGLSQRLKPTSIREIVRGFSYYQYGKHYAPSHTNIPTDVDASYSRVMEYLRHEASIVCIAFSYGGFIFTQGIEQALAKNTMQSVIKRLILIQPAFGLHEDARGLAEKATRKPAPIADFLAAQNLAEKTGQKNEIEERIIQSLGEVVRYGIPVIMLYWKDDRFIAYSPEFRRRLEEVKVDIKETEITLTGRDDLYDHIKVARDDAVLDELAVIVKADV